MTRDFNHLFLPVGITQLDIFIPSECWVRLITCKIPRGFHTKMNKQEYEQEIQKTDNRFELCSLDLHNLYDLLSHCVNKKQVKAIKLGEWFDDFFSELQDAVVPELKYKSKG